MIMIGIALAVTMLNTVPGKAAPPASRPAAPAATAPAATPFGRYGGSQVRLDLSAAGGTLETDCAAGRIDGPVRFDAHGRFAASGSFEAFAPGPQAGDSSGAAVPARFTGNLDGTRLTLTVHAGRTAPLVLHLDQGRRAKIVRCL